MITYEEFKKMLIENVIKNGDYTEADGDFDKWWKAHNGEVYAKDGFEMVQKRGYTPAQAVSAAGWNIFMS